MFYRFLAVSIPLLIVSVFSIYFGRAPAPKKSEMPHTSYKETISFKKHREKSENLTVDFEMIAVPGGKFTMGSPKDEANRNVDEGPQFEVSIPHLWVGKCEVTWDEFDAFWLYSNPKVRPAEELEKDDFVDGKTMPSEPYFDETHGYERSEHPAICMTQHFAMKYCEWLSKKTGKAYRLLTEAEWEYCCRAGSTSRYSFDETKIDDYAWYIKNSKDQTHPKGTTHRVGTKKPNAFGLHDMHGNVMEWCFDHYVEDAYTRFAKLAIGGIVARPHYKPVDRYRHNVRGGHFQSKPEELRCAARVGSVPLWMKYDAQIPQSIWWLASNERVGFRICRSFDEGDPLNVYRSTSKDDDNEVFVPK
jgi:formylglycine-generating enzyme required for sulfatase activity